MFTLLNQAAANFFQQDQSRLARLKRLRAVLLEMKEKNDAERNESWQYQFLCTVSAVLACCFFQDVILFSASKNTTNPFPSLFIAMIAGIVIHEFSSHDGQVIPRHIFDVLYAMRDLDIIANDQLRSELFAREDATTSMRQLQKDHIFIVFLEGDVLPGNAKAVHLRSSIQLRDYPLLNKDGFVPGARFISRESFFEKLESFLGKVRVAISTEEQRIDRNREPVFPLPGFRGH